MRGRNLNLIAFVLVCGAIAYHDMKKCHKLPWPPRFIFAGLAFFMMEIITLFDETLGGVTAIGFVIATFMKDGFVATCQESQQSTGHPSNVEFVGDYTGPSQGIPSVNEFQQGQSQATTPGNQGTTLV